MSDSHEKNRAAHGVPPGEDKRRDFLKTVGIGGVSLGLGAVAGGPAIAFVAYPIFNTTVSGSGGFVKVGKSDAFKEGHPVKVDLFADKRDAWNRIVKVKVGSAWVMREGTSFARIAGVPAPRLRRRFRRGPSRSSSARATTRRFQPVGKVEGGPAPRRMDTLEFEEKEDWSRFGISASGRASRKERSSDEGGPRLARRAHRGSRALGGLANEQVPEARAPLRIRQRVDVPVHATGRARHPARDLLQRVRDRRVGEHRYLNDQVTAGWFLRGSPSRFSAMVDRTAFHFLQTVIAGAIGARASSTGSRARHGRPGAGFCAHRLSAALGPEGLLGNAGRHRDHGERARRRAAARAASGRAEYGNPRLTRFYALHVFVLPTGSASRS